MISRFVTPGSTHRAPVDRVDLQHPLEPRERDHHAVGHRERAPGEPGARAAGHERHLVLGADPHRGGHLGGVAGEQHQLGTHPVAGEPVALVGPALHRVREHVRRIEHPLERLSHPAVKRHGLPPPLRVDGPVETTTGKALAPKSVAGRGPRERPTSVTGGPALSSSLEVSVGPRRTLQLSLLVAAALALVLALSGAIGPAASDPLVVTPAVSSSP